MGGWMLGSCVLIPGWSSCPSCRVSKLSWRMNSQVLSLLTWPMTIHVSLSCNLVNKTIYNVLKGNAPPGFLLCILLEKLFGPPPGPLLFL